jgi:hypothetical protein
MRKLMLMVLALVISTAAFLSPAPATASGCITYCSDPNPCGYVCCYMQCCGNRCVDLDCAPPPPCEGTN